MTKAERAQFRADLAAKRDAVTREEQEATQARITVSHSRCFIVAVVLTGHHHDDMHCIHHMCWIGSLRSDAHVYDVLFFFPHLVWPSVCTYVCRGC